MEWVMIAVVLVVVGVVAWFILGGAALGKSAGSGQMTAQELSDSSQALRYNVPNGQDPAVLVAALSRAGYDAQDDPVAGGSSLLIARRDGSAPARSDVRSLIERSNKTSFEGPGIEGPVTFEDED